MGKQKTKIKALGEIALRVRNLDLMREFYQNVLCLEIHGQFEGIVFFRVALGFEGHVQELVLFDESLPPDHTSRTFSGLNAHTTTLHHVAFAISLADFASEKERLEQLDLDVETQEHEWVHWRSLYFPDPEGNLVELVCYDESVT